MFRFANMSQMVNGLSLVIPVYNRPDEVDELLLSLSKQSDKNFEVVIVEDGSSKKCDEVVDRYKHLLDISYHFKSNTGPGQSRNYGSERVKLDYIVFLDSDCVIPPGYVAAVRNSLNSDFTDAFGGPDAAHDSFTSLQKAINYAMTSFLTTGGIRGGGEKLDKFFPRSFNMGYSKKVFDTTKGFSPMRFGEDIDMSIRILSSGFRTKLIKEGFVFHKRRTNIRQFFKQVHNSGIARINLFRRHPGSLKMVHALPTAFVVGSLILIIASFVISPLALLPLILLAALLFIDATIRTRSLYIGALAVMASFIQLIGYGTGFIRAFWKRIILGKDEFSAFEKNFYK
jgi:glycosyltransferase involved in cell wall biosynthesis